MKKSIIIYADCIAIVEELTNEQAGKLFRAILSYINEEPVTEIQGDPAVNMAFKVIKRQIDRDAEKYAQICERRRENILKRWQKEHSNTNGSKDDKSILKNTKVNKSIQTDYDNGNENDSDSDSEFTNVNNTTLAPNGASSPKAGDSINFVSLVAFFNKTITDCNSVIRPIKDIKGKRQDAVRARVRERGKNSLVKVIENAAKSDFLNGKNDRGFIATFDWLVSPNNYIKVLEGNYDNRKSKTDQMAEWRKEDEARQAREQEERERSKAEAVTREEYLKMKKEGKI